MSLENGSMDYSIPIKTMDVSDKGYDGLVSELEFELEQNVGDFSESGTSTTTTNSNGDTDLSKRRKLQQYSLDVEKTTKRTWIAAGVVLWMGAAASICMMYLGITNSKDEAESTFDQRARDMALELDLSWSEYEDAALWIHESMRHWRKDNITAVDFESLYHYLLAGGLDFYTCEWVPNVTHAQRPALEEEGRNIWANVTGANYRGFMGQEPNENGNLQFAPRSEQPYYQIIHYAEPKENAAGVAHYDLLSPPWQSPVILQALRTWEPALTPPFKLQQEADEFGYSVVLFHPGPPLPAKFAATTPLDLSGLVIHVRSLLNTALSQQSHSLAVYLYDATDTVDQKPQLMAAMQVIVDHNNQRQETILPETNETQYNFLRDQHSSSDLYFEKDRPIGGRVWKMVVLPAGDSNQPQIAFPVTVGVLLFVISVFLAAFMMYNMHRSIQLHRVVAAAAAEASIVSNLFPKAVKKRMIQDAKIKQERRKEFARTGSVRSSITFQPQQQSTKELLVKQSSEQKLRNLLSSEGIFGSKPIADLHPYTTVMVADLCGFSAWASIRDPSSILTLLEIVFHSWDSIAHRHRVCKVDTVGDTYVAVAGYPRSQQDHAVIMAQFATDCAQRMQKLCKELERTLGPETSELGCRFGLASGQVVAGVLRGDKGRFQLFGETVDLAAQMEATGIKNKIQVTSETADLISKEGHGKWIVRREGEVFVKGKGNTQTFFVDTSNGSTRVLGLGASANVEPLNGERESAKLVATKHRLVEWNVEVLCGLLKSILARREAKTKDREEATYVPNRVPTKGKMVLDEVAEVVALPAFRVSTIIRQKDPDKIELDVEVVRELTNLIAALASMYRSNPFHNFEHACHVTLSTVKMLSRIVNPKEIAAKKDEGRTQKKLDQELHDNTFGITSDPLTQFAVVFSAIIHDLDHMGLPNNVLVKEESPLAKKYNNKSIAEQNSVDLCFAELMKPAYEKLRATICCSEQEFARFRSLVVNSVMATDIMDKDLGAARKERWNKAFSYTVGGGAEENEQVTINRKATIVIEHLIQASDVSHTMQHWHVYAKWNENLFHELYNAYKAGRLEKDPSLGWYQGELGFFEFYIIPLANKLFKCGVFGVSSDELLNHAQANRKEWELKGEAMVEQYLKNHKERYGT